MHCVVEIINRFSSPKDLQEIIYDRTVTGYSYAKTKVYVIEYEGEESLIKKFVEMVFADKVVDNKEYNGKPFYSDAIYIIDVELKPGVLDLEKEYAFRYKDILSNEGLVIKDLKISQRYYLFGKHSERVKEVFIKSGPINSVIHSYKEVRSIRKKKQEAR
ncbi:MAG: hypothetical protein AB1765_06235 [Candidatus Hydrogenedentota bacterium]